MALRGCSNQTYDMSDLATIAGSQRGVWEELGNVVPWWSVLSSPEFDGTNQLTDDKITKFYDTGEAPRRNIDVMREVADSIRASAPDAMEEDDELPKWRGLEILVSEHVLDDGDGMHETDEERARRMRLSRDERRRRGADAKEEEDFIVDLHHKPDETRRRKIDGTRPTTSEDTIAERRRQHQLKRRVVDAEHKLPNELNNFDQRFIAQSKLIWKRMEKHAKYVYSGEFMKDL